MICLSSTASSIDGVLADIAGHSRWIDAVELRIDLLEIWDSDGLRLFPQAVLEETGRDLPLIGTVRRSSDGGRSTASDGERLQILRTAVEAGFHYIDLEADLPPDATRSLEAACLTRGTRIIWSLHDIFGMPEGLTDLLDTLPRTPDGIAKIAVTPNSTEDLLRLLEASDRCSVRERIVVGMGPFGTVTRVAPERFGSFLSFCSVPGSSAAPGHLTPQVLAQTYRLRDQRAGWPLFAVVGNPVAHSRSPAYHNGRFLASGTHALYVPILVDSVPALFTLADRLPLLGISVTIPHKQEVIKHVAHLSPEVAATGAANTLVRAPDGWRGLNTDVLGFLAPLEELVESLEGIRALVLGAGGASRGIVFGLARAGAIVSVHNRTTARATTLCDELSSLPDAFSHPPVTVTAAELQNADQRMDVIINTTSLGMNGNGDPAPWLSFHGSEIVYDIVYTPPQTPFIMRAAEAGCRVITGDRMFDAQAAAQFELYSALATGTADG